VQQRDPCGPLLYALTQQFAIHPTEQLHPSTFVTSYADDTYIVGPTPDVFAAYNTLISRLQSLGLTVQPSMCSLYGLSDIPPDATLPPNLTVTSNGLVVTGVPIGSDSFIISSVDQKLRSFGVSLPLLHDLHNPQTMSRLFTLCVLARPSFLLYTVPPFLEITELYTNLDNGLLDHFTHLIGSEFWPPEFDHLSSEGLGFESQCVHLGHPSAGGCQRSTGDPRLILGKGYRHVVMGGYGRTDPLLSKPFYPNVVGILTLSTAHHQPFLPIRLGGFGLRSSAGFADLSFLCIWAQTVSLLSSHFFIAGAPIFRHFISNDTIDRLDSCIVSAMSHLPPDILHHFPSWPALISGYPHKLYS
ncbi:unnamed protein product, partial [Closterium sp. NIES-53]